jgi:hypothetical protein
MTMAKATKRHIRQTSAKAFKEEMENGNIPRRRREVFEYLFYHGPKTGSELDYELRYPSAHKRLSELKEMGLIIELGGRKCTITGKDVVEWDVR